MMLSRRGLLGWLGGGAALLAAPAIVRASSLMPVKAWEPGFYCAGYSFNGYESGPVEAIFTRAEYRYSQGATEIFINGVPIAEVRAADLAPDRFHLLQYRGARSFL
jgi:hypothetical protein